MPEAQLTHLVAAPIGITYGVVADVARYPDFLPWCLGARLYRDRKASFDADLLVGFGAFREKFTSRVYADINKSITIDYLRGPMRSLQNTWTFSDLGGQTEVSFRIAFEFTNPVMAKIASENFERACNKILSAFEARATHIYALMQKAPPR